MSLDKKSKNSQLNKIQEYAECGKERDWYECWGQVLARFDLPEERKREANLIFQDIVEHGLANLHMDFTPTKEQQVYLHALDEAEAHLIYLKRQEITRIISGAIKRWREQ